MFEESPKNEKLNIVALQRWKFPLDTKATCSRHIRLQLLQLPPSFTCVWPTSQTGCPPSLALIWQSVLCSHWFSRLFVVSTSATAKKRLSFPHDYWSTTYKPRRCPSSEFIHELCAGSICICPLMSVNSSAEVKGKEFKLSLVVWLRHWCLCSCSCWCRHNRTPHRTSLGSDF